MALHRDRRQTDADFSPCLYISLTPHFTVSQRIDVVVNPLGLIIWTVFFEAWLSGLIIKRFNWKYTEGCWDSPRRPDNYMVSYLTDVDNRLGCGSVQRVLLGPDRIAYKAINSGAFAIGHTGSNNFMLYGSRGSLCGGLIWACCFALWSKTIEKLKFV